MLERHKDKLYNHYPSLHHPIPGNPIPRLVPPLLSFPLPYSKQLWLWQSFFLTSESFSCYTESLLGGVGIWHEARRHLWVAAFKWSHSEIHTEDWTQFWRVTQKERTMSSLPVSWKGTDFNNLKSHKPRKKQGRFSEMKIWTFLLRMLSWEVWLCGRETLRLWYLRWLWGVRWGSWTSVTLCECVVVSDESELCWD